MKRESNFFKSECNWNKALLTSSIHNQQQLSGQIGFVYTQIWKVSWSRPKLNNQIMRAFFWAQVKLISFRQRVHNYSIINSSFAAIRLDRRESDGHKFILIKRPFNSTNVCREWDGTHKILANCWPSWILRGHNWFKIIKGSILNASIWLGAGVSWIVCIIQELLWAARWMLNE